MRWDMSDNKRVINLREEIDVERKFRKKFSLIF